MNDRPFYVIAIAHQQVVVNERENSGKEWNRSIPVKKLNNPTNVQV